MKKESVLLAMDRAQVFVMRAKQLVNERGERGAELEWQRGTRASGRLRRASLDLSDSLVAMRKPGWVAWKKLEMEDER